LLSIPSRVTILLTRLFVTTDVCKGRVTVQTHLFVTTDVCKGRVTVQTRLFVTTDVCKGRVTVQTRLFVTTDERGLQNGIDRYSMEAEVCNYFSFAEQGITVALRPGDMLLFNPLYQHCLSSRTSFYKQNDVFCLSLHLKTAVVGGNDNSLP
jgi:hypothetical protein